MIMLQYDRRQVEDVKENMRIRSTGCLMTRHDLATRKGWWLYRIEIWRLNMSIKYPLFANIYYRLKKIRFKIIIKDGKLYLKDQLTRKIKQVGLFG